jgi:hypothetical protein
VSPCPKRFHNGVDLTLLADLGFRLLAGDDEHLPFSC